MERAPHRTTHRRSPGVGARILLLALIPVVGLSLALGALVQAARARLDTSRAVSAQITQLHDLADLHLAMTTERLTTMGIVRLARLGIAEQLIDERFDLDLRGMLAESRSIVDERLSDLADTGMLATDDMSADLDEIRTGMTAPDADPGDLSRRFEQMLDEVGGAVDREVLASSADGADVREMIGASMGRLHAALDAHRFGSLQLSSMSDVWFADDVTRPAAVHAVAKYTALLEHSLTLLRGAGDPEIEQWATVLDSPQIANFDQAVRAVLEGPPPHGATITDAAAQAFGGATFRQLRLADLVAVTFEDAQSRARHEQDVARADILRLTFLATGAAVVTVALGGWCAYTIARPLRRLIDRTERIRDGDLSADSTRLTGPNDLRRAAATVEELVDNLRLLEAKAVALARYDLDDPVLEADLAGPLGSSLQRSAAVLRESIAAREELQQRLWHAANHDSLTGIANRSAAIEQLRTALADASVWEDVAVLFIDLDDFKRANDAHGHAAGDEILRVTARRMRDVVRPSDIVGRLGGDEFVIGLPGAGDAVIAQSLAERLLQAIRRPIDVNGLSVTVGASVGVALGARGERPSDVMARADLAVYQAKQRDSSIHVYDEALHREVQTRTGLEKDLAAALERDDGLQLNYQPIVDVYTGEVLRVEALLRWDRPGHGAVSPEIFVPAAESSTLIIDVDRWVLTRAMTQAAQWAGRALHDAIGIAINVSGRHVLSDSFVATVRGALTSSGIEPSRVTLELTESVLVDDLERAAANLRAVRELGVGVYIDDFGTGYTSIAHLHALPIDGIKIDRSFVGALPGPRELTLVRTLIELGVQLGLTVVAEGVETDEQKTIVASLGCESIQGFLVGRPCSADAIAALLAEERSSTG